MKQITAWILVAGVAIGAMNSAQAFSIPFALSLCTLQSQELDDSVRNFQNRLAWVKRFQAVGSQYRKHVERHSGELIDAFDAAQQQPSCTAERKVRIQQFKTEIEDLRAGRPGA